MAGWLAGGGWLEKPILMKTQSSALTWTLDFDLGFVNNALDVKKCKFVFFIARDWLNQRIEK